MTPLMLLALFLFACALTDPPPPPPVVPRVVADSAADTASEPQPPHFPEAH